MASLHGDCRGLPPDVRRRVRSRRDQRTSLDLRISLRLLRRWRCISAFRDELLLRDGPGGYINAAVADVINRLYRPIPLRSWSWLLSPLERIRVARSRLGWQLRAIGSDEESARRIGVRIDRTFVAGYIASSLFTALGRHAVRTDRCRRSPARRELYASSITAVVLGGTSLRGGRGTFIGTSSARSCHGSSHAATFLGLSEPISTYFKASRP